MSETLRRPNPMVVKYAFKAAKYYGIYKIVDLFSGGRIGKVIGNVAKPAINYVKKLAN